MLDPRAARVASHPRRRGGNDSVHGHSVTGRQVIHRSIHPDDRSEAGREDEYRRGRRAEAHVAGALTLPSSPGAPGSISLQNLPGSDWDDIRAT